MAGRFAERLSAPCISTISLAMAKPSPAPSWRACSGCRTGGSSRISARTLPVECRGRCHSRQGVRGVDGHAAPPELLRGHRCCYVLCGDPRDVRPRHALPNGSGAAAGNRRGFPSPAPVYWENSRVTMIGRSGSAMNRPAALMAARLRLAATRVRLTSAGTRMSAGCLRRCHDRRDKTG
jgi:hypothetical protein